MFWLLYRMQLYNLTADPMDVTPAVFPTCFACSMPFNAALSSQPVAHSPPMDAEDVNPRVFPICFACSMLLCAAASPARGS